MGVASRLFGGLESAPQHRTDPKRVKIIRRDHVPGHALGPFVDAERGPHNLVLDQRVDQRAIPPKINEIGP
jgi:hypothetical protein